MNDDLQLLNVPGTYSSIWYANQFRADRAVPYKYSGGLGTYPQQHAPLAIYREDVNRTYFVWGDGDVRPGVGSNPDGGEWPGDTISCIGYFDHARGAFSEPRRLLRRNVIDAHENPVLCIDPAGHLLVFCPAHGIRRPAAVLRSREPHDITHFDLVKTWPAGDNFSYPQAWWHPDAGLVLFHTRYENHQRRQAVCFSPDGLDWSGWDSPTWLSRMGKGSYQMSWMDSDGQLVCVFDYHPQVEGDQPLNHRRNVYLIRSNDGGTSWVDPAGQPLDLPLVEEANTARLLDTQQEDALAYIKEVRFDPAGRAVVTLITSKTCWAGPDNGEVTWWMMRETSDKHWKRTKITTSDHPYDHGSLYFASDTDWKLVAPTSPGVDRFGTGGQMMLWESRDAGESWSAVREMTDAASNHTYARPVFNGHNDLAWIWAQGRAHEPSSSQLWVADVNGQTRSPFVEKNQ